MTDDRPKDSRIAMTLTEIDANRLRDAARAAGMPAATLARTLVRYGLDNIATPSIDQAVRDAASAEAKRRHEAGLIGGVKRQAQRKKKET